jgi:hypothetical protein
MATIRRKHTVEELEPIGIVISRGTRDEASPKVWAYVWAPAPEDSTETVEPRAA